MFRRHLITLATLLVLTLGASAFALAPALALASDDSALEARERLADAARSGEEVTFWIGTDPESPDYSWTFNGALLEPSQAEHLPPLELGIALSEQSLAGRSTDALALQFAWQGELPIPARLAVRLPPSLKTASGLALYRLDALTGSYALEQPEIELEGGYARFMVYSTEPLLLSAQDLAGLAAAAVTASPSATAGRAGGPGSSLAQALAPEGPDSLGQGSSALPWVIAAALAAVLLVIAAAALIRQRRERAIAEMEEGWFKDMPSIDKLVAAADGNPASAGANPADTGEPIEDIEEPPPDKP